MGVVKRPWLINHIALSFSLLSLPLSLSLFFQLIWFRSGLAGRLPHLSISVGSSWGNHLIGCSWLLFDVPECPALPDTPADRKLRHIKRFLINTERVDYTTQGAWREREGRRVKGKDRRMERGEDGEGKEEKPGPARPKLPRLGSDWEARGNIIGL